MGYEALVGDGRRVAPTTLRLILSALRRDGRPKSSMSAAKIARPVPAEASAEGIVAP